MCEQLCDQAFSVLIAWMRLAGEHDLEWMLACNRLQSFKICEQQVRALVGSHAPCKSQDRDIRFQHHPGKHLYLVDQMLLVTNMRLPDRDIRNTAIGTHQQLRFMAPARQVMIVKLLELFCRPSERMHAVGDRMDLVTREHRR